MLAPSYRGSSAGVRTTGASVIGHAVLSPEYRWSFLWFLVCLLTNLPLFCPFPLWGTWQVRLQDEQGGQFVKHVYFGTMFMDIPGGKIMFDDRR